MYKWPCEWSQQKIETQLAIFVITFLSCCYGNCPKNKISLESTSSYPCENILYCKLTGHVKSRGELGIFETQKSTSMPSLLVLFWVIGAQLLGHTVISRMVLVSFALLLLLLSQELLSLASATKRPKPTQSSGSDSSSESGSDDEVSQVPVTWGLAALHTH